MRIAGDPQAHLQAVGRDEAGRLQYIYHEAWEDVRAQAKALRLKRLGLVLPDLRQRVFLLIKSAGSVDWNRPKGGAGAASGARRGPGRRGRGASAAK